MKIGILLTSVYYVAISQSWPSRETTSFGFSKGTPASHTVSGEMASLCFTGNDFHSVYVDAGW
jgi:hypothetical protein